jgi:hypothetical protein
MVKKTRIFTLILIIIVLIVIIAYFLNFFSRFGLCRPGMKFFRAPVGGQKICYTLSGYEGKFCTNKTDCGTASCILVFDETWKINKSRCENIPICYINETKTVNKSKCIYMLVGHSCYIHEDKTIKGICRDMPIGCSVEIYEQGNLGPAICVE